MLQRISNLASVSDDPVLLTARPGFNTSAHPWIRITALAQTHEQIEAVEQEALYQFARGVIGNRVLNPVLAQRPGWQPWTETDDLTAVYETPIGLLIRLGVQGHDPRSGLDPIQFMAPALSLVQQLTAASREESRVDAGPRESALVLPGSCGGGKWHVHQQRIRFTKLVLNEIPYLADLIALALQFAAAALGYEHVEVPGDCILYANVTSRSGIFVPASTPAQEDAMATGEHQFRALRSLVWPVEGGPSTFRAPLMKHQRALALEQIRFSRPETRPKLDKLPRGDMPQLLPSVYADLELATPHPLGRFSTLTQKRVAALWDTYWRETLNRAHLRPGERPASIESHLHVPFGRDSRIHVHDVTNSLDQLDRGRLRGSTAGAQPQSPTRVLELTDYRHPLADSQPAVRSEIIAEIELLVDVAEAAQEVMPGLVILFTQRILDTWRQMRPPNEVPAKLRVVGESINLWRV